MRQWGNLGPLPLPLHPTLAAIARSVNDRPSLHCCCQSRRHALPPPRPCVPPPPRPPSARRQINGLQARDTTSLLLLPQPPTFLHQTSYLKGSGLPPCVTSQWHSRAGREAIDHPLLLCYPGPRADTREEPATHPRNVCHCGYSYIATQRQPWGKAY